MPVATILVIASIIILLPKYSSKEEVIKEIKTEQQKIKEENYFEAPATETNEYFEERIDIKPSTESSFLLPKDLQ